MIRTPPRPAALAAALVLAFGGAAGGIAALRPAQEPAPLGPGVVARLDGEDITLAAYQDFLWRQTGKRALGQMVDELLLEKACARFGIRDDAEAAARAAEERLQQSVQGRDPAAHEADLRARGFSSDMLRALFTAEALREQRLDALVRATRAATDARIRAAFEALHGPGGTKTEVRHVLFMPHVLRAERIRAGADARELDQEALKRESRAAAEAARARVLAGEDFAAVAAEVSQDQVSKKEGGRIQNYRAGLYGPAFGAAVDALAPGGVSEVVESGAGFHVIQVVARTVTRLEDVRAQLAEEVLTAPPTWQEREELLEALRGKARLEAW